MAAMFCYYCVCDPICEKPTCDEVSKKKFTKNL